MGDNIPDFSSMTPEEQMRWLESLAKRQGADQGQFMTDASMEVDEVDPETADMTHVGPGYTPSETFSFSKRDEETPQPAQQASAMPEQEIPPTEFAEAAPAADSNLAETDPMAFLQALAKRQGADPSQFVDAAEIDVPEIDPETADMSHVGPGYTPSETFSFSKRDEEPAAPPPPMQEAAPPEAETPPAEPAAIDMGSLAETDPMAFLQALARRQGADPSQFVDAAEIDVPEIDPETADMSHVGPGYTPSETFSFSKRDEEPAAPPPPMQEEAEPEAPSLLPESPEEEPSFAYDDAELEAEADPMQWLESIAGSQEDDIFADLGLEVNEVDPAATDFLIDAQDTEAVEAILDLGISPAPDAPFDTPPEAAQPPDPLSEMPSDHPPAAPYADASDLDEENAMAWLENLAEEGGEDVTDFLSELTDDDDLLPGFDLEYDEDPAALSLNLGEEQYDGDDLMEGLSDADIAQMQAEGTITPEQELQWLTQKANLMSEILEEEDFPESDEEAAEPGEMPDWLQAKIMQQTETSEEYPAFVDDITTPPTPDDLPDWIVEDADEDLVDFDIPELEVEDTSQQQAVDSGEKEAIGLNENILSEYDPSLDHWTEALEQEFMEGDLVEDQDIYERAFEEVESEMAALLEDVDIAEPAIETPQIAATENAAEADWFTEVSEEQDPTELPDWLQMSPENEPTDIDRWLREQQLGADVDEDMAWVTEPIPGVDDVEEEQMDWLSGVADNVDAVIEPEPEAESTPPVPTPAVSATRSAPAPAAPQGEILPEGVDGAVPDWYHKATTPSQAAPTPQPQRQAPPPPRHAAPTPQPQREVALPDAALQHLYATLQQNPNDHSTRLNLARGLKNGQKIKDSLQEYETLINQHVMLEAVAEDLQGMIAQRNLHPKVRRLLGDVYMRQGRLQEALDTYRGALSQI